MPIKPNREYRNLSVLQPATTEKRIDTEYYVEGYATTFNDPYELWEFDGVKYYEVIDRNAFNECDMSDVILQFDHVGRVFARNSNNSLIVEADEHGLFVCADLSKTATSRSLYEDIKEGLITRMSFAFIVADDEYNRETRTRTIKKIKKVFDVSAVSIPANQDTEISARSYIDGVIDVENREAAERKRQLLKLRLSLLED